MSSNPYWVERSVNEVVTSYAKDKDELSMDIKCEATTKDEDCRADYSSRAQMAKGILMVETTQWTSLVFGYQQRFMQIALSIHITVRNS